MAITAAQAAALRKQLNLPPDPASDAIWASRPWATSADVTAALQQKVASGEVRTTSISIGDAYTRPDSGVPTAPSGDFTTGQPSTGADYGGVAIQEPSGTGAPRGVDAEQEARRQSSDAMRLFAKQSGVHPDLIDMFIDFWVKDGDSSGALAQVRDNPQYDTYYPGNRRKDGTFRYSEAQYGVITEAYAGALADEGVNPDLFAAKFGDLIAGNVSVAEFKSRVNSLSQRIINAPDEVKEAWGKQFGFANPTAAHILGVALDPALGDAALNKEINVAEIAGAGSRFGFSRGRGRLEQMSAEGLDYATAKSFYSSASTALPTLAGASGRANEGGFGIGDLEDAAVFGLGNSQRRLNRIQSRERSLFSGSASVSGDGSALTGLTKR